jgi:hypothetical protein
VNWEVLDVVGVVNEIVAFAVTDPIAFVYGVAVEIPEEEPEGGALVIIALTDEELDPVAVARTVPVSETRVPVRLYAAAQAARDIPCTG